MTTYDDDELAGFFHERAHGAGLQVGVHAIGDRAIEQVLAAWERVYGTLDSRERRHFRARRHRIEHFEMASPAQVERAADAGPGRLGAAGLRSLWGQPGGLYEQGLGAERAMAMNPFRTMLERGVEVGVGSDSPVTPLDPMATVRGAARTITTRAATRCEPRRSACTRSGSARLGHQEEKKGMLEPGMTRGLRRLRRRSVHGLEVEGTAAGADRLAGPRGLRGVRALPHLVTLSAGLG